jgi:hypothetical protein
MIDSAEKEGKITPGKVGLAGSRVPLSNKK